MLNIKQNLIVEEQGLYLHFVLFFMFSLNSFILAFFDCFLRSTFDFSCVCMLCNEESRDFSLGGTEKLDLLSEDSEQKEDLVVFS